MVQAVIDPIRVPTINLTGEELEEIRRGIADGDLPRDYLDRYHEAVAQKRLWRRL